MTLIDIRPALKVLLLSNSELSTMIGGNRIYPGKLPQGLMPTAAVVYNEISNEGDYTLDGPSGLARPRYQVDGWAKLADDAHRLGLLIQETLTGYKGTVSFGSNSPQSSVVVRGIFMESSRSIWDDPSGLYGSSKDFIIWFAER